MNKPLLALSLCLLVPVIHAAEPPPDPRDESVASIRAAFPNLAYLSVKPMESLDTTATVGYLAKGTTIINKARKNLPASHPLRPTQDLSDDDVLLMETSLGGAERYFVVFTLGPSMDPGFYFVKTTATDENSWREIPATALAIPANGFVYTATRANSHFTKRRKYAASPDGLRELPQPFYSVGLQTRAIKPITLYSSPKEDAVVAQLAAGHAIEVVLTDDQPDKQSRTCFLVRTPMGLLGWVWVPSSQFRADTIEGISWWGD
jgi:hypothetical protein